MFEKFQKYENVVGQLIGLSSHQDVKPEQKSNLPSLQAPLSPKKEKESALGKKRALSQDESLSLQRSKHLKEEPKSFYHDRKPSLHIGMINNRKQFKEKGKTRRRNTPKKTKFWFTVLNIAIEKTSRSPASDPSSSSLSDQKPSSSDPSGVFDKNPQLSFHKKTRSTACFNRKPRSLEMNSIASSPFNSIFMTRFISNFLTCLNLSAIFVLPLFLSSLDGQIQFWSSRSMA